MDNEIIIINTCHSVFVNIANRIVTVLQNHGLPDTKMLIRSLDRV